MQISKILTLGAILGTSFLNAGTIVVSGDANIGNGINGSAGATVQPGNTTFFHNLLGAGTNVVIEGPATTFNTDNSEVTSEAAIATYYSGLIGVTVNQVATGAVTAATLANTNLFISILNNTGYSTAEVSAINALLARGGTVLFEGEYDNGSGGTYDQGADADINTALASLGSSMSINLTTYDSGFTTATGTQIKSAPLDAGITGFEYAAVASVSGGTPVFSTLEGPAFLSEQVITAVAAPEPGTISLALGAGFILLSRRRSVKA